MNSRSIDQRQRRAGEKISDVLEFAHPRHGIADPPRLEIGHRQRQQMAEQPRAEFDVDAVGGVREQIGSQDAEHGLEHRDRNEADHQHVERAQRAVHQHLVDHHLEEQRRDQREDLQEERRDQHLAEQAPVLVDRAEKPGDVEAPADIGQSGAAGHQDQPAVPDREQFGLGHESRTRLAGHLHQHLVLGGFADDR